jgi:hypothetical protein
MHEVEHTPPAVLTGVGVETRTCLRRQQSVSLRLLLVGRTE